MVERCLRRIGENEEALQEQQERRLWIAYKQGIEQSRLQIDAELRLISRDRPG
jgi:hypothetical protein